MCKLKSCPFCGSRAYRKRCKDLGFYGIICKHDDCFLKNYTSWSSSEEEAENRWNQRLQDETKRASKRSQINVFRSFWDKIIKCMRVAEEKLEFGHKLGFQETSEQVKKLRQEMEDMSEKKESG